MQKIRILDKEIAGLIAAGEVIERPLSVVKELVENAIDANSTKIIVEIKKGGISYIKVSDNGSGMSKEDAENAFYKHATSKLFEKNDLFNIKTLGFRGEALSSISMCSKVELITKEKDNLNAWKLNVIDGLVTDCTETGSVDGSIFIVRDLFYNIPVRLKFLKSEMAETAMITNLIERLAISCPHISFTYKIDEKEQFFTSGNNELKDVIYNIFGEEFVNNMLKVEYIQDNIKVYGFTGKPLYNKANRNYQLFYVNNRFIKTPIIQYALENAYKSSIMTKRYPIAVLFIEIPYNDVDINVHPNKMEIKFFNEKSVFNNVNTAINNSFLFDNKPVEINITDKAAIIDKLINDINDINNKKEVYPEQNEKIYDDWKIVNNNTVSYDFYVSEDDNVEETEINAPIVFIKNDVKNEEFKQIDIVEDVSVKVVGEVYSSYIICERTDEMLIIDKHALHERIIYEKLITGKEINSQTLLTPIIINLGHLEKSALMTVREQINKIGIIFEDFGSADIIIRSIPQILNINDTEELLEEFSKILLSSKNQADVLLNKFYYDIACKSAIKAGKSSSLEELNILINEYLKNADSLKYCPHGRPIILNITKKSLEKHFKRIV